MRPLTLFFFALPLLAQPHLFLNEADFERIRSRTQSDSWAASSIDTIKTFAAGWPKSHTDKYALTSYAIPDKGGQWGQHYVCPRHGVSLTFSAPSTHRCPIDAETFRGWPYDDVIVSRRHADLADAARELALAFRFTGERRYGEQAAWILTQYAEVYPNYALHDKDGRSTRSGARARAQTLDEAIWLIPLAWAYDLLSGTDVMTEEQRAKVERDLLRACVETVRRNDAGVSNWQSWHNAGVGAVAFALNDAELIERVVNGKSGFRFQMQRSVEGEGFWYEGAWGYHYYALDALMQTAEMAARNGIDLWQEPQMRGLFLTPLKLSFPDGTLPNFNDSASVSLYSYDRLYEVALARLGDPLLASVLGRRTRHRNALFWGTPSLPPAESVSPESAVFPDSGYAVVRSASSDHTVMMKFGPHGGGHGHYDKLGLISYGLGGLLGIDPGTQSYAAPTHNTWDKQTVAHNTVTVDERTQAEATGKLIWFDKGEGYAAARAEAGPAYKTAALTRTLVSTGDYLLDLFDAVSLDGAAHKFDWTYHNAGRLEMDLPTEPYGALPQSAGYQHLTGNRAGDGSADWAVRFDGSAATATTYGSTYQSTANVRARYERTPEFSFQGNGSGKASYVLTGAGYLMFTTPVFSGLPVEKPTGLTVMIHGDGSGHRLALRLYDATDERFVATIGPVTWTGWRKLEVRNPETWSHYLGNADGIFDAPVRTVSVELTAVEGGPAEGALHVDDITLEYAAGPRLVEDFEFNTRSARIWMIGEAVTTVVGGEGLGPDLRVNVPYVMARREATATTFASVIEPYRGVHRITGFERTGEASYRVTTDAWVDDLVLLTTGVQYKRTAR